jgi:hypothetical protein
LEFLDMQAGEGVRTHSLEAKVEAYRQQLADLRAARIAAVAAEEQQQQGTAPARTPSPFEAVSGTPHAAAAATDGDSSGNGRRQGASLSPTPTAESSLPSSPTNNRQQQQQQQQHMGAKGGSKSFNLKKIFAGGSGKMRKTKSAAAGAVMGGKGLFDQEDEWDDTPDEVRLGARGGGGGFPGGR